MALRDEFEPLRGSINHRSPLPTVADAVSELIAEETRSSISYVPLDTDAVCLCSESKVSVSFCALVLD